MSMTQEQFDQLSEGLLYMSETDAPLTYYELAQEKSQQFHGRPISAVDWSGPGGASGEACARKILQRFTARQ